ncbi:MAG: NAD-glutamate dehydrogenase, partial [Hyphomicrobiales bacterium]
LAFIPRDRFNTRVRVNVGELLAKAYDGGVSAFYPAFPEGSLVRVHYIIGRVEGATPSPDVAELELQVLEIVKTWDDRLGEAIAAHCEPDQAAALKNCYVNAFSGAYQEAFEPAQALGDIDHIEGLTAEGDLGIDFYRGPNDAETRLRLKIYHMGEPIALSDRLPILENMGLRAIDERSYKVSCAGDGEVAIVWIHEIALEAAEGEGIKLDTVKPALEACFLAVWRGDAENDTYNSLVLKKNLAWRDVSMLRACGKYLRQTGLAFSARYVESTLISYSDIAALLVNLFYARFGLDGAAKARDGAQKRILSKIETKLQDVPSLDQDRILRRFANLITVALRTNYFQTAEDGTHRPAIAIKIRSKEVDGLPEPRPYAEIFVYSPDVEGVHLRFGMIARGGLRWSDRPEDFRTEVLGLVKAQQVKNAVIVPVGAKGGFVPKHLGQATTREEFLNEGVRCYMMFISSLLDVTDNLDGAKLVPPKEVVRHDGDDPYLVVAADKGTATFSDIANGISDDRGHWLSDAFASGGSAGYDHKKMGITARGGWEAVKRHFREMDRDIQTTPFTVIGVGDMSGDVFGNGMLLSKQTKLLAAFDHRDIIIDPDPDPAASYKERKRLFNTPGTTWADYDAKLISKGGGVFSRSLKSIGLSDQIRALTGLTGKQAAPLELIQALLKSEADLLWFGGIGTYIRASTETDDDAGDRANDAVRITAKELRVKVIGEGANLGLTQRSRIEFALNGGRVNTDAVDNSAGVNSSDVEVNIKITLGAAEAAGKLTRPARNKLLAEMTDEVAALCLRNNYVQTLALTLIETRGLAEIGFQSRLMRKLEHAGELDRAIEFLPDEADMVEREAQSSPLTRPELSVLLAYAKITLFDRLLASKVPDDPYLESDLMRYFPTRLQDKYPDEIRGHRLRREIIATMLANSMINRGGASFINRIIDETGADEAAIATAY